MRRITILPEKIGDDVKTTITRLYQGNIEEIDAKNANEILVRSSPKDTKVRALQIRQQNSFNSLNSKGNKLLLSEPTNEKYCQYPPVGSSSVSVTTEDYYCLEDESFLNDVVIDFYFKWLQFAKIPPADRDRTHIFSTFFYKRLTTRPPKSKDKLHPVEDNVNLSPAEKRYERVKRWTKKVNLFEKDFSRIS